MSCPPALECLGCQAYAPQGPWPVQGATPFLSHLPWAVGCLALTAFVLRASMHGARSFFGLWEASAMCNSQFARSSGQCCMICRCCEQLRKCSFRRCLTPPPKEGTLRTARLNPSGASIQMYPVACRQVAQEVARTAGEILADRTSRRRDRVCEGSPVLATCFVLRCAVRVSFVLLALRHRRHLYVRACFH